MGPVKRRLFMQLAAGSTAASCGAAFSQHAKVQRVGALILGNSDTAALERELKAGLAKAGYVEGRNVEFDIRSAQGRADALPALAAALVAAKPDVLIGVLTPCARALQQATSEVPIVVMVANAVETGLMGSLSRPGGNITGVSMLAAEAHGKCVEVFGEMLPGLKKVAALGNAGDPFMPLFLEKVQMFGRTSRIDILSAPVRSAEEIDAAVAAAMKNGAKALVMQGSLPGRVVAEVTTNRRLPAGTFTRAFVDQGGLMSYGPSSAYSYQRVAQFAAKILAGARPGALPAEQPTVFELAINRATAEAIGLSVPKALLARADHVVG